MNATFPVNKISNGLNGEIKGDMLYLQIPIQTPVASKSGKNIVLATTHGNHPFNLAFNGYQLIGGVNVYYKSGVVKEAEKVK